MAIRSSFLIFIVIVLSHAAYCQNTTITGGERIFWIDDTTWLSGTSPGYTGLGSTIVDSYVISNYGLTFNGNHTYLNVTDTLIIYGDVTFTAQSGAAVSVGPNNVLIIFGSLDMGKNHAGIDIGAGGMVIVTGNISSSGTGGDITGEGTVYTDGTTDGMAGGNDGGEHPIDDLSDDDGDNEGDYDSIEEFIKGGGTTPLPVEMIYFGAEAERFVKLSWATATEINNDYFSIERSEDSEYFYEIGQVAGNGNSKKTIEYSYEDKGAFAPVEYYRIKQVDYDGAYEYSPIVRVQTSVSDVRREVNVFPYEVLDGQLTIEANKPFNTKEKTVYSLTGTQYTDLLHFQPTSGGLGYQINVSALPAGMYFINLVTTEGEKFTGRFLIR